MLYEYEYTTGVCQEIYNNEDCNFDGVSARVAVNFDFFPFILDLLTPIQ